MTEQVVIRDFAGLKTSVVFELVRKVYTTSEYMSDEFHRKFNSIEDFKAYRDQILSGSGSFFIVAILDKKPVGYLTLEVNNAIHLQHTSTLNMGVMKAYRGTGIGKSLLKHTINRVKTEQSIEIIYLMVRAENIPAIRLYKNFGFHELVKLEKDTKIGNEYFDGILMRRFI